MRLVSLLLVAGTVGCGGRTSADRPPPTQPQTGCPPSHELRDGRCTVREVYVPGGSFTMGRGFCPESETEQSPAEFECLLADAPHLVEVAPFWVDATLHTAAALEAGITAPPLLDDANCPSRELECAAPLTYAPFSVPLGGLPYVTPHELGTDGLCGLVGKRAIREAEWEWLATWGGTRTYPWGEAEPSCEHGYVDSSQCTPNNPPEWDPDEDTVSRVASYRPTPEGIYDLTGSLGEWVLPSPNEAYTDGYPAPIAELPQVCASSTWSGHCSGVGKDELFGHRGGAADHPTHHFNGAYRGTSRKSNGRWKRAAFRCVRGAE